MQNLLKLISTITLIIIALSFNVSAQIVPQSLTNYESERKSLNFVDQYKEFVLVENGDFLSVLSIDDDGQLYVVYGSNIPKCDMDETHMGKSDIPISQKQRLRDRASAVNRLYHKHKKQGVKIQRAIEIHVDSRSKNTRQDVFFYYNKNNTKSKELAKTVQEVFDSKYARHQKDRGYEGFVEDRGIYMVRSVLPDMVFVELANIRNQADQKRLLINSNRQALANWLFEGLRK